MMGRMTMTKGFTVFVVGLFIAVAALICFSTLTNPKQNASFKILTGSEFSR